LSFIGPVKETLPAAEVYEAVDRYPADLHQAPVERLKNDFRILHAMLYPIVYYPADGRLYYFEEITVRIELQPGPEILLRRQPTRNKAQYLKHLVDNPRTVASYEDAEVAARSNLYGDSLLNPLADFQYVIITSSALSDSAFVDLVANKQSRGVTATLVTTEWIYANYSGDRPDGGSDNQTRIRNFVIDAYASWGTEYVLLGGGADIVPPR
jgi:hypothetical protein